MVFSSLSFLIVFLPVLLVLFFAVPQKWGHTRQYILLVFSLVFYSAGEPRYIFLIAACILISWMLSESVNKGSRPAFLLSILVNIVPLIVTKYAGFLAANMNTVFRGLTIPVPEIVMPIGISFYTFQMITYLVDLHHGEIVRQKNPLLFALYIMFFPQLIAGPIVRYSEVAVSLEHPDVSWDNIRYGFGRLITGLGKKVLIANQAGYIASTIQNCPTDSLNAGMSWLCVLAFTIQLYFDFSGYSEMAIGLGSIFGFHFPENFADPYTSVSLSDCWKRWHITLGRFFREYVYIPLGGNRVSRPRWIFNTLLVWSLTGLWHGASWNYVFWGLYNGVLILFEKITGISKKLPKPLAWVTTFFLWTLGLGIFMCDGFSLAEMSGFLGRLFSGRDPVNPVTIGSLQLWGYIPFLVFGVLISTPVGVAVRKKAAGASWITRPACSLVHDLLLILLFFTSFLFLIGGTYNPFIYFRF